jgi:hypothetical protein
MNTFKALTAAVALLALTGTAQAQTYRFNESVTTCYQWVRSNYNPGFGAYVVNDGTASRVRTFGSNGDNFNFDYCMNRLGHPLHDVPR